MDDKRKEIELKLEKRLENLVQRMKYVSSELSASNRHDGYVIEGLKKELESLKEKYKQNRQS